MNLYEVAEDPADRLVTPVRDADGRRAVSGATAISRTTRRGV
jgi:hypothetical protein